MNFEGSDKSLIKNINSNLIRAERAEETVARIKYSTEVVNDAISFSLILKNRGDLKHSMEYIETAMNINRVIMSMLQREHTVVFLKFYTEDKRRIF